MPALQLFIRVISLIGENSFYPAHNCLPYPVCGHRPLSTSCKKCDHHVAPDYPEPDREPGNYVANPQFVKQSSTGLPYSWKASFNSYNPGSLDISEGEIILIGNSQHSFYLYQPVQLEANRYYKISIDCNYSIHDFSPAGLYVFDSALTTVLGKSEKYDTKGSDKLEFVISTQKDSLINLVIGCINSINGRIVFKHPVIEEYEFRARIQNSAFSNFLVPELKLAFTPHRFDESIQALANLVNEVLLSDLQGRVMIFSDQFHSLSSNDYPYLTTYLNNLDSITTAYCQKSSLSLGEILYNEFNIPVRQIHMQAGGIGFHQFLEYWNPYKNKWIVIDPYFGIVYEKGQSLLSKAEISREDISASMKRITQYAYSTSTEEFMEYWQTTEEIHTTYDPYLSLPYGNQVTKPGN